MADFGTGPDCRAVAGRRTVAAGMEEPVQGTGCLEEVDSAVAGVVASSFERASRNHQARVTGILDSAVDIALQPGAARGPQTVVLDRPRRVSKQAALVRVQRCGLGRVVAVGVGERKITKKQVDDVRGKRKPKQSTYLWRSLLLLATWISLVGLLAGLCSHPLANASRPLSRLVFTHVATCLLLAAWWRRSGLGSVVCNCGSTALRCSEF